MDNLDEITLLTALFALAFGVYSVYLFYLHKRHVPTPSNYKHDSYGYALQQGLRSMRGIIVTSAMAISMLLSMLSQTFNHSAPLASFVLAGISLVGVTVAGLLSVKILSDARNKSP